MKLEINLEILRATDCKYLSVLDTSLYPTEPTSATLSIYVPGYENPFTFEDFVHSSVNIYNSYNFQLSVEDALVSLPDGLYKFVYDTCPATITTTFYHLRTCSIRCRLAEQWAKYVTACCNGEKVLYELDKIEFLLRGAEANAQLCNPNAATELYEKADELLQRIEDPCTD